MCPLPPRCNTTGGPLRPSLLSKGSPPQLGCTGREEWGALGQPRSATSLHPPALMSGGCLANLKGFPLQRPLQRLRSVLLPSFLPGNKPRPGDSERKKRQR